MEIAGEMYSSGGGGGRPVSGGIPRQTRGSSVGLRGRGALGVSRLGSRAQSFPAAGAKRNIYGEVVGHMGPVGAGSHERAAGKSLPKTKPNTVLTKAVEQFKQRGGMAPPRTTTVPRVYIFDIFCCSNHFLFSTSRLSSTQMRRSNSDLYL